MTTVVFVHGTGVRRPSYDASFVQVREALSGRAGLAIEPCYWGDLGATRAALSVPGAPARAADPDQEYAVSLWGVLYEDPLYELRILKLREGRVEAVLGQLPPGEEMAAKATGYRPSAAVEVGLEKAGLQAAFPAARKEVVESPVFVEALESATEALEEYRAAISRAWVARSIQIRRERDPAAPWVAASLRDELVRRLIEELGGRELAFSDFAKKSFLSLGTRLVQGSRAELSSDASPIAGDILLYQGRGEAIQDRIRTAVRQAAQPVVVLAHSLGGIASVDLLVKEKLPVHALVTVGSQAPLFHEIGALRSLERGKDLPAHFPRWLNIFDQRDFLSYVGARVFAGRVEDVEVDNGQPFPVSHSAYWENDDVWLAVGREIP